MKFSKFLAASLLILVGVTFSACDKKDDEEEKDSVKAGVHRVEIELKSSESLDYILQVIPSSNKGACDMYYELETGADGAVSDFTGGSSVGSMVQEMSTVDGRKKIIYYTSNNCTNLNVSLSLIAAFETIEYSYTINFFVDGVETKSYSDEGVTKTSVQRMFNSAE
jgi:hypothetical protein